MARARGGEEIPSLIAIAEKAKQREAAFDSSEARLTAEWHNPGRASPLMVKSGRFIQSGNKRHVEVVERFYETQEQEKRYQYLFTFDGQTARHFEPESKRGMVFRDLDRALNRKQYYGPQILGIIIPGTDGQPLSAVLKGASIASKVFGRLRKTITILALTDVDGEPAWPVEVLVTDGTTRAETHLIFLSERYDLAPLRIDHLMTVDGQQRLLERLHLSGFTEVKNGLWYPTDGRYETFQLKPEPQQTATYHINDIAWRTDFDADLFTIQFPPGTHVFDQIAGSNFTAGGDISESSLSDEDAT